MAEETDGLINVLVALYNRNEQYHDMKDKIIWIAASVYLGFSLGALSWLFDNRFSWPVKPWILIVSLCLIFTPTLVFILRQNWEKCKSVKKTELFDSLIETLGTNKDHKLTYKEIYKILNPEKIPLWYSFWHRGWPGTIILSVVVLFFLAQIFLLCLFSYVEISLLQKWIL